MSEHPTSLEDLIGGQAGAAHSIFSPSGSAMWLRCLGSLIPNVLAGDDAGEEAAEGTVAHDIADEWTKTGIRPDHLVGTTRVENGFDIEITEEMLAYIQNYLDWCEDTGYLGLTDYSEERVDTSILMPIPNQGGTADRFALGIMPDGGGIAVLTDLKYGKGVPVFCAEEPNDSRCVVVYDDGTFWLNGNTQVLLYMAGVFIRYDHIYHFQRIVVRICQPRLGYFGVWETTRKDLLDFMQFIMDRAPGCLDPNAPRTPGPKQCQFCRVRKTCPAVLAYAEEMLADVFTDLTATNGTYDAATMDRVTETISDPLVLPFERICNPREIPIHALEKILPMRRIIEGWFEDIAAYLTDAAVVDEAVLRVYKVVEGRTNRQFIDEAKAAKELLSKGLTKDDLYKTTMVSPAQAEEALHKRLSVRKAEAKAMLEGLAYQPPGPKSLALRTDSRPELPAAGDVFTDLTQPEN
ncbi:hypothetical protein [Sphingomonas phage Carli]|nr:hypothetical protein [Sphingomonas phage Carli]